MTINKRTYTKAGSAFRAALTTWLQDTRLMSEAAYRPSQDYQGKGLINFSNESWPKGKSAFELKEFKIVPVTLGQRMFVLLKSIWTAQFVFL